MASTPMQEQERPPAVPTLARASGALLDRLFAPHGPSAYFRWVTPGGADSPPRQAADVLVDAGPAAVVPARTPEVAPARPERTPRPAGPITDLTATGEVSFRRSGLAAVAQGTLLETAEAAGLMPRNRCRRGICGTCTTPKLSGTVVDARTGETSDATGPIRICVSVPQGDVALDL